MRGMMSELRLTVNETKTRLCRMPEETFDFLGYTIGRCWSPKTGKSYIGTKPSAKKIDRLKREISDQTSRRWSWTDVEDQVARLNRMLLGWSNHFCLGPVSRAYRAIDRHGRHRLRQWLCAKHKVKSRGTSRFPDQYLNDKLGLLRLTQGRRAFRGRKYEFLSESPVRENRPPGSMSGEWKRSKVRLLRHRQPKGPATDRPSLNHRVTPRLYSVIFDSRSGCAARDDPLGSGGRRPGSSPIHKMAVRCPARRNALSQRSSLAMEP